MSGTFNLCALGYQSSEQATSGGGGLSNPLAKVSFWLDGGSRVDVTSSNSMETFPAGTAHYYCVQVSDASVPDGKHELRACLYPLRGYPRCLQSLHSAVTTAAGFNDQAHGFRSYKVVKVIANPNSDANFTGNSNWCVAATNLAPGFYQLGALTSGYPMDGSLPICTEPTQAPTAAGETLTLAVMNAGLTESNVIGSNSLFFSTNFNGTMLPANPSVYLASSGGNDSPNSCFDAAHPCATMAGALGKLNPNGNGVSCSYNGGISTTQFTSCGTWPVNQAVLMTAGTPPGNFSPIVMSASSSPINRPYWIVSSSGGTITLALKPGGPAQAFTANSVGSVTIRADNSYENLYLECNVSTACSSPTNFAQNTTNQLTNFYGWFNLIPYQTTAVNTVITPGTSYTYPAFKTHYQVSLAGNAKGCQWWMGFNDVWYDTMQITNAYANFFQFDGFTCSLTEAFGNEIMTGITVPSQSLEGFTGTVSNSIAIGNTINRTLTSGLGLSWVMKLGNVENNLFQDDQNMLQWASNTTSTVTFNTANTPFPPQLVKANLSPSPNTCGAPNCWSTGFVTGAPITTQPVSGCMPNSANSGSTALTDINGSTITVTPATVGTPASPPACASGDFIPISAPGHIHWSINSIGESSSGNYTTGGFTNALDAYNQCNNCGPPGILTQANGPTHIGANIDTAYINDYYNPSLAVSCTVSNYQMCSLNSTQADSEAIMTINRLYDGDTWDAPSVAGREFVVSTGPTVTFTDVYINNNSCLNSAAGRMQAGWGGKAGFTIAASPTC
jgi:hypothetical protein